MTTPGGVPNLPVGGMTLEDLASKLQDMTTPAMRGRAAERLPGIFGGSSGGNPLGELTPFGILTKIFAGFNSHVANANPSDIDGPEDLPGLLIDFIESLPVIGELVGLLEAIMGTYDGDDTVLIEIQKIFQAIRDLFGILSFLGQDIEVVWEGIVSLFITPLNVFSIPADVQASINEALGFTKAALEGTYTGTDPIFLAVKAAAAQWLTGSSALNAGNLTGTLDGGVIPSLPQSKIADLIADLAAKAVPADVTAAVVDIQGALAGSYSGSNSTLLAVKALAAAWLTPASDLDAGNLTGTIDDGRIPALPQSKIADLIADLAAKATPGDVSAAVTNLKAALEGSYSGSDSVLLAVKAAAAAWLTGSSTISQSQVSGLATALAALTSTANFQSLLNSVFDGANGSTGSTGKTIPQVLAALQGQRTATTTAGTDAAAAQADANTAQASALATITQIFNKLGGNNASTATLSQAAKEMEKLTGTVGALGVAISELQTDASGTAGFRESVAFRQAETTVYDTAGNFTYTLPSWFTLGVDYIDGILLPGGGGADGVGVGATGGGNGGNSALTVNGTARTATGGLGGAAGTRVGVGPGPTAYLDKPYLGGGNQATGGGAGNVPGGGGGAYVNSTNRFGGEDGVWNAFSVVPTSATITGSTGVGGTGGSGLGGAGGAGAPGVVHVVARRAMNTKFTSLGTQILPTYRLNTGVAQSDAMTAVGIWSRVPPNGASGGYMLKIRSNTAGTNYVYLRIWVVSGVTNYEIGRVSSGTKFVWKTGTVGDAIPFNAWSITSDGAYTFTVAVNGSGLDSYTDTGSASAKGPTQREGHWATSDTLSGGSGSILQFAFFDSGTPSRITSAEVATSQGTTSTTFANLATTGPSVTINVPLSGEVTVDLSAMFQTSATNQQGFMGVTLSGANTEAASDAKAASITGNPTGGVQGVMSRRLHYPGLAQGTTTFQAQFRTSAGTGTFSNRILIVKPEP